MADSLQEAIAVLEASRQKLRVQMIPAIDNGPGPGEKRDLWPRRVQALWRHGRRALRRVPLLGWVDEALSDAWRLHPWRPTVELLGGELRGEALTLVRRHPVGSVLVAAAVGAVVAAAQPWRWPLVADQLRPMPRHAGRWLLRQLGRAPWQAALFGALAMMRQHEAGPPAAKEGTPPTPAQEPV